MITSPLDVVSTVILVGNAHVVAKALLLVAPSPEYAAGVVAYAVALGAASPEMERIIRDRWQFWNVPEVLP